VAAGASASAAAAAATAALPPAQTPLARHPQPGPPTKKKGSMRTVDSFSGITLAGSGIGARVSLGSSAPIANTTSAALEGGATGGGEAAADVEAAAGGSGSSAGKRPMDANDAAPPAKRAADES
jgi:hypothetical protein